MTESSSPGPAHSPAALHDLPATSDERRAAGKAARKRARRGTLGYWAEEERGHDALKTILAQNQIRVRELVPIRHHRMAASAWNYYRGAAAVMASDLASQPSSGLVVQLCGDAHILNFGLWATPERNLSFDLRGAVGRLIPRNPAEHHGVGKAAAAGVNGHVPPVPARGAGPVEQNRCGGRLTDPWAGS